MITPRRVWVTGFLSFWLVGALWSLAVPVMGYVDEPSHTIFAAAVVRGEVAAPTTSVRAGVDGPVNATQTEVRVPRAYASLYDVPACHQFDWEQPAGCAPPVGNDRTPTEQNTPAGTYDPVYYAVIGWPTLVLPPSAAIRAMRIVSAGLVAAMLATALVSLTRMEGPGLRYAGGALALSPMALHLAGGINPNGLEIAAGVALWAAALEVLATRRTGMSVARLTLAASVLVVSRPLSPVWLIGILATAALLGADRSLLRQIAGSRRNRLLGVAVGGVVGFAVAWLVWRHTLGAFNGTPDPTAVGLDAVRGSLDLTMVRVEQMVGRLGWIDVVLPRVVRWLWYLAVPLLALAALVVGTWRERVVVLGLALAVVLIPVVAEARSAADIGYAWQGRYSLPYVAGLPLVSGWILDRNRRVRDGLRAWAGTITWGLVGAVAAAQILALVTALRRYEVGASKPPLAFLSGGTWEPPLGDGVLLGLFVVSVLALPVAGALVTRRRPH
jgi:hypothetical protein